jgi:hypothetical protein
MPTPSPDGPPLLVLDRIERDPGAPGRLIGTVRMAGHAQRVVVDIGNPFGLVEYIDIPLLLGSHDPSLAAVVAAMSRWEQGEDLALPLDLTDEVRDAEPPFPLRPSSPVDRERLDEAADRVDLVVVDVERSTAHPAVLSASLVLGGVPLTVQVEIPGDSDEGVMRWISGPPTVTFSKAELHAIYRALLPYAPGSS